MTGWNGFWNVASTRMKRIEIDPISRKERPDCRPIWRLAKSVVCSKSYIQHPSFESIAISRFLSFGDNGSLSVLVSVFRRVVHLDRILNACYWLNSCAVCARRDVVVGDDKPSELQQI